MDGPQKASRHHTVDRRYGRLRAIWRAYPVEIGPAIWAIHSARVLDANEMNEPLALARHRLEDWQVWVNPDCGLKTRGWG
jgi:methionine synthase II (cobalamin-independent)